MISPKDATPEQVEDLVNALEQILDDMGLNSQSACLYSKAQARIALEPFVDEEVRQFYMPLEDAIEIVEEST